jgi:hypothetical protein
MRMRATDATLQTKARLSKAIRAVEVRAVNAYRAELAAKVRALPQSSAVVWYPLDATGTATPLDAVLALIEAEP